MQVSYIMCSQLCGGWVDQEIDLGVWTGLRLRLELDNISKMERLSPDCGRGELRHEAPGPPGQAVIRCPLQSQ